MPENLFKDIASQKVLFLVDDNLLSGIDLSEEFHNFVVCG
jgi:hypothetical protein